MLNIESSSADVLQMMSWMTTLAIQILVPMTVVGCAIREPLTVNCMAQSSVSPCCLHATPAVAVYVAAFQWMQQ